jgi:hypothetical protein
LEWSAISQLRPHLLRTTPQLFRKYFEMRNKRSDSSEANRPALRRRARVRSGIPISIARASRSRPLLDSALVMPQMTTQPRVVRFIAVSSSRGARGWIHVF